MCEIPKYFNSYLQYLEHDLVDGEAFLGSGPVPGGDLEEFRWQMSVSRSRHRQCIIQISSGSLALTVALEG